MENFTVTPLVQPGEFSYLLTEVLRSGAQRFLAHAIEAEVAGFIETHAGERPDDGRARFVHHGHLPNATFKPALVPCASSNLGWVIAALTAIVRIR